MYRLGLLGIALTWLIGLTACSGNPEVPPTPDPDRARECYGPGIDAGLRGDGGALGCLAGQICLQGRCYESCASDDDCGPEEQCGASGACVRGTRQDAGARDAGPTGPCDGVECTDPQVCHPVSGTCVDCNEATAGSGVGEPGHCSSLSPICDIANGTCVPVGPRECAPCNSSEECVADGVFNGSCVPRETHGVREHDCLALCPDGACPNGLTCTAVTDLASSTEVMVCVPPIDMPCTNWLAGAGSSSCLADADCAAAGATLSVYTDACEGEVVPTDPDGGAPTPGHCLLPCSTSDQCLDPTTQQCIVSDGQTLPFCRPL